MNTIRSIQQMLAYRLLLLLLMMPLMCMCKKGVDPETPTIVGEVYTVVDQLPTFPGGQTELGNFLMKNLRYPAEAQRAKIQGKVIVGFVVTTAGRIENVKIQQSIGGGCDEESMRVVKAMPDWIPGLLNGKPVNVQTSLPFSFTII